MSLSSLRGRDEIDAKSTSDTNMIEMKKKRSDNDKTVKELRAKTLLIAELYESKAKEMMSVLDQLIKTIDQDIARHACERRLFCVQIDKDNQKVERDDDTIEKNREKEENISEKEQHLSDDCATRDRNDQI